MPASDALSFLPLSPAILHILLALASEEQHGYAIMQQVRTHSQGQYRIGPGTLYDNLQKLLTQKLVAESRHAGPVEDPRRRYYRLSKLGRTVLASELSRLEDVVREGRRRLQPVVGR